MEGKPPSEDKAEEFYGKLRRETTKLGLSVRSENSAQNAGLEKVWQLCEKTKEELRSLKFGPKSINEVVELLGENGLALGMKIPDDVKRPQ
jgi:DNA-directed RNA polymerase subunit alpha